MCATSLCYAYSSVDTNPILAHLSPIPPTPQRFARNPNPKGKVAVDSRFKAVLEDDRFQDAGISRRVARGAAPAPARRAASASLYTLEEGGKAGASKDASGVNLGADANADVDVDADTSATLPRKKVKKVNTKRAEARLAEKDTRFAAGSAWADAENDAAGEYEAALQDALEGGDEEDGDADADADANADTDAAPARNAVEERLAKLAQIARGAAEFSDSDATDSEPEPDDSDAEAERVAAELNAPTDVIVDPEAPDLEDVAMDTVEGSETSRLAIVGLDWDHVRAVDIQAVLASGVPLRGGGAVVRVSVFLSEYGVKRLAEEVREGPTVLIRAAAKAAPRGDDEEADPILLRQYELNKMKYYFAIAECDSAATAAAIYDAIDGLELEASSNVMDLRFVPDGTTFARAPTDVSTLVPGDYEAPQFATQALQSSRVELSWDQDEGARARALQWDRLVPAKPVVAKGKAAKRAARAAAAAKKEAGGLGGDDDNDDLGDIKAYLASDEESSVGEEENINSAAPARKKAKKDKSGDRAKAAKLRAMLLGDGGSVGSVPDRSDDEVEEDDDDLVSGGEDDGEMDGDVDDSEDEDDEDEEEEAEAKSASVRVRRGRESQSITVDTSLSTSLAKRAREGTLAVNATMETPWESFLRKRKEKRREKKAGRKAGGEDKDEEEGGGLEEDAFFGGGKDKDKASSKRPRGDGDAPAVALPAASDAELDLLTMGDEDDNNFDLKDLLRAQKKATKAAAKALRDGKGKGKGKGGALPVAPAAPAADGAFSVSDTRFAAALSNPEFAIDPTAAAFKDTAGMRSVLKERLRLGVGAGGGGAAADGARASRAMVVIRADASRPTNVARADQDWTDDGAAMAPESVMDMAASLKSRVAQLGKGKGGSGGTSAHQR